MSSQGAVELHKFPHLPQGLMSSIGEAQFDSRAPQQYHLAVVLGEFRERTRRIDGRHADAPAERIAAGRHPYRFVRDAAAILPGSGREGGLADDLQLGI